MKNQNAVEAQLKEIDAKIEELLKPFLCGNLCEENKKLLESLEKNGLSYKFVIYIIRNRSIPRLKSAEQVLNRRDKIIEQIALIPKAFELKKYDPKRFEELVETIRAIHTLAKSGFISDQGQLALKHEMNNIRVEWDLDAFIDATEKYSDRFDEGLTTDRYAIGKMVDVLSGYLKEILCEMTQKESFGIIADFFNAFPDLLEEANKGKKFDGERIRQLYWNYIEN